MYSLFYVVGREGFIERKLTTAGPDRILRRNFSRGVESLLRICANEFAQQSFAASLAVCPGGVEEITSEIYSAL